MEWLFPAGINYYELFKVNNRKNLSFQQLSRIASFFLLLILFFYTFFLFDADVVLLYFTNWGNFITLFYFGFLIATEKIEDKNSIVHKVKQAACETIFSANCMITIFFWGALAYPWRDWLLSRAYIAIGMSLAHSLSIAAISLEIWLNKMIFYWPHLLFVLFFPLLYFALYIFDVFYWDYTAYPVLTMKSWDSLFVTLISCGLFVGSFWVGDHLTKNRKVNFHKLEDY